MQSTQKSLELKAKFINYSIQIIKLTKLIPRNIENIVIVKQVIRSSTSVGANYSEAICALTRPDFIHCLNISKKEINETLYWLEMLRQLNPTYEEKLSELILEGETFLKILIASVKTAQKNNI
jgi:four helix bundle protein